MTSYMDRCDCNHKSYEYTFGIYPAKEIRGQAHHFKQGYQGCIIYSSIDAASDRIKVQRGFCLRTCNSGCCAGGTSDKKGQSQINEPVEENKELVLNKFMENGIPVYHTIGNHDADACPLENTLVFLIILG